MPQPRLFRRVRRGVALPALVVLTWWLATRFGWVNLHLVPPPAKVVAEARRFFATDDLWTNLGASIGRDLVGFALGATAGLAVGGALGCWRAFDRVVGPTFHAIKQVAIFAWIPLLSFWFGYGESAKVTLIALAAFFPVVLNTREGVAAVHADHLEVARVLRLSRFQVGRRIIVPAATPAIFAGLRLALITAWIATIGAEYFLAVGPGIGRLMIEGREQFRMDRVLLGIAITGLVGFAMASFAGRLESHLVRWRRPAF